MCCFLVPLAQAVATSAYRKAIEDRNVSSSVLKSNIPALEKMLWGGSVMLVVDHIINGELTWQFPFFTALEQGGWNAMSHELLSVGVPMSVVLTAVWAIWSLVKTRTAVTKTV